MNFKNFAPILFLAAATGALPLSAVAAQCSQGKPTEESHNWNFAGEASHLLAAVQEDAAQVASHAAAVQSLAKDRYVTWEAHAGELMRARREVDDMGGKLCRLEQIRRVLSPWQQKAIDEAAPQLRLMADNATDAINFLNGHHDSLWVPTYSKYADNLYREASAVSGSVKEFEQLAAAQQQEQRLSKELGAVPRS